MQTKMSKIKSFNANKVENNAIYLHDKITAFCGFVSERWKT